MADAGDWDPRISYVVLAGGQRPQRETLEQLLLAGADGAQGFIDCAVTDDALETARSSQHAIACIVVIDGDSSSALPTALTRLGANTRWPVVVGTFASLRERSQMLLRTGVQDVFSCQSATADSLTRCVENAIQRFSMQSLLRERDLSLRLAVEAAGLGLWTWEMQTDAVTWSPEVYRMLGIDEGALRPTGSTFFGLIAADDRARVEAEVRAAISEQRPYHAEFRLVRPDGNVLWLENRGRAVYDDNGAPLRMLGTAADISARKSQEEALRRAQLLVQSVLEGAPALVFAKDLQGEYFLANRAWRELVGLGERSLEGVRDDELFTPAVASELLSHDRQALASPTPLAFEESTVVAGRQRTYVSSKFALRDDAGAPYAVCGISVDVTQLKETQRALAHRERELQSLADNSPDIIARFDRQHRHVFISAAVEAVTGMPPNAFLGKTNRDLGMPPALCDRWDAALDEAFATAQPREISFEFQKNAATSLFRARLTPELDALGQVESVLCVTRDRTVEHQHEEMLTEAARRKDEFLATLAHELRNPLAPLRAGFDVLRHTSDPARRSRAQDMMRRQLEHMVHLVDDLLDVSRISHGRIDLRRSVVSLASVVDIALETSRPLFEEQRHRLELRLPADTLWIDGDPTRLAQVLGNLLNNAAKYTPSGGSVTLSAEVRAGRVLVRVADSGIGIAPDMLAKVFGLFAQAEHSLDRAKGGLGIGLSLVKTLVELHGGTVSAESSGPGRGSVFTVELPLAAAPAAAVPRQVAETRALAQRVLVVDDNVDGADMLAMMLGLAGHEVRCAHDGVGALKAARDFSPTYVFLDIGLPGMDGYEVARRLRAEPHGRTAFLVALTGWGSQDDKRRASEAGFDFHLTKPVDLDAVNELFPSAGSV